VKRTQIGASKKIGDVARVATGNFLEMYDFMIFGYYASAIAQTFFPRQTEFNSLMLSLATFGAGFLMRPLGAIVLGAIASVVCFFAVTRLKPRLGYDDALDTFGVHGVGGMIGALGTGIVYSAALGGPSPDGWEMGHQLVVQAETVGTTIVWSAFGTAISIVIAKLLTGLRVAEQVEREGLDLGEHGERAYNY